MWSSYPHHLYTDNISEVCLKAKLYDERDDLNFSILNFPFICWNILAAPAYGVYIPQLIRYSRACGSYHDFLDIWLLQTWNLLDQRFLVAKLSLSHRKFSVATVNWLTVTEYLPHKWPRIRSVCCNHYPVLSSFMTYYRLCNKSNTTSVTSGVGSAYYSGAPHVFSGVYFAQSLVFCLMFYRSRFIRLFFFFSLLYCLFFFDLRFINTTLVVSSVFCQNQTHDWIILHCFTCQC